MTASGTTASLGVTIENFRGDEAGSGIATQLAVVHIGQRRLGLHTVGPSGSVGPEVRWVDLSVVPGQPHEVRFDRRRRLLYVSHTYLDGWYLVNDGPGRHISVVDVETAQLIGAIDLGAIDLGADAAPAHGAHDLWVDTARDLLWASVEAAPDCPGGLVAIDPETRQLRARVDAGARAAHWFAVLPDGSRAYTANKDAPFVSVLDLEAEQLVAQIAVPGSEGIAAGGDGRVFVAGPCRLPGVAPAPAGVRVIDSRSDTVVDLLEMTHAPGAVHVTDNGLLLVAEMRVATGAGLPVDGMLRMFSATSLQPLGAVPIGASVLTMTSSVGGGLAFVADAHGGAVTVVDLARYQVVATIPNTPGAHGLAVIPAAHQH